MANRTCYRPRGCSVCAGQALETGVNDLATLAPHLVGEWAERENGDARPETTLGRSHTKVWWRCTRGHTFEAAPASRVDGAGCPFCAGRQVWPGFNDLATTHPLVASWWDADRNGDLTPQQVTAGSNKQVWLVCERGHTRHPHVYDAVKSTHCHRCRLEDEAAARRA